MNKFTSILNLIARDAFNKMKKVLTSSQITLATRMKILSCYVWSTLLYGSENFNINGTTAKNIEEFEMWTIRIMLRISWIKKVTNEIV